MGAADEGAQAQGWLRDSVLRHLRDIQGELSGGQLVYRIGAQQRERILGPDAIRN
jgi:hypothetical protein